MSRSRRSRPGDRGQRDQRELIWRKIDLHLHTPASVDYADPDISYLDILRKAEARGADIIAFTDHNTVRGYANLWREIEDLELLEALERLTPAEQRRLDDYRRLLKKIRVLPGFELTATFGFHILAIFPEGTSIRQMEHVLLALHVPEDRIDLGTSEVGATSDVLRAYEILHEAGALVIPAHVNSTHGVAMQNLPFGGQTKIAFTQSPYIDALEATDLESASRRSTARFFNGSKPEYPRRMHIIQGSDAHRLNRDPNRETNLGVGDRMTEVLIPELSFAALKELFQSDSFNRVRPYRPSHDPYDFIRTARSEGNTIIQSFHEAVLVSASRHGAILRDVCAFANGNGGTIYVGLSASPKDPVVGVSNAPIHAKSIAEDIARYITPPVAGSLDIQESDDKQIIVITIPAGDDKPYAVAPSTIYVRQEGDSDLAERDEIVQLVREGLAATQGELPELVSEVPATPLGQAIEQLVESTTVRPPSPDAADVPVHDRPRTSRRRRGGRGHAEQPGPGGTDAADELTSEEPAQLAEVVPPSPPAENRLAAEEAVPYPRTGVEVVDSTTKDGVTFHTMRDLRNLKVIHNVTRDSARRLWRYAIGQQETNTCRPEDVAWHGDRGFWKSYKPRGGDVRFNLVFRHDDHLHVFYGVTDEGLDDAWREAIPERLLSRQASEMIDQAEQPDEVGEPLETDDIVVDPSPMVIDEPSTAAIEDVIVADEIDVAAHSELTIANGEVSTVAINDAEPAPDEAPPVPARRRRSPRKKAEVESVPASEPSVDETVVAAAETQSAPEELAEAADEAPPKPVRRRRTTRKTAEPEVTAGDDTAPQEAVVALAAEQPGVDEQGVAASTELQPEPEPEKPARPRRTRRKKELELTQQAEPIEPVAPVEAAPAVVEAIEQQVTDAAEEQPAKPVRRRRVPRKKADTDLSEADEEGVVPPPSDDASVASAEQARDTDQGA